MTKGKEVRHTRALRLSPDLGLSLNRRMMLMAGRWALRAMAG